MIAGEPHTATIAVGVPTDTEIHADMGQTANAVELADRAKEGRDAIRLIFDEVRCAPDSGD